MAVRLDKWLWATRFFKTRDLAVDAIKAGKVRVNHARAKPARLVNSGDTLAIKRDFEKFEITVTGLTEKRVGAKLAVDMYQESEESIALRIEAAKKRAVEYQSASPPETRPSGKERGKIRRFRGKD